jgi:hypothetical protein
MPDAWRTSQNGRVVELQTGSELNIAGTLKIAGVAVDATAAELNAGADVAAGVITASKAVVANSDGAITNTGGHVDIRPRLTSGDVAGKTVRIGSITNTGTANSLIGFQSKPGQGASTAENVMGGEISPRLNDAIALTGSGSIIGLHVDCYIKGTTGNIAGDVRGIQIELVDDTGSSRTVAGNVTHLRVRSNLSCAVTGKYSAIRVENEEGTKALDGLLQFTTGSGCIVEASATVGGTQDQAIKVLIGSTTYYVPLHTSIS